ncbi:hypothetical protein PENTCL1PPCAC_1202, partial [Pristionchus entomophagus]
VTMRSVLLLATTAAVLALTSARGPRSRLDLCNYYAILGKLDEHPECASLRGTNALVVPTTTKKPRGAPTTAAPKRPMLCSSAVALTQCASDAVACPESGQVCTQSDGNKCCQVATNGIPVSEINAKQGYCPRPLGISVLQDNAIGCWMDASCPGIQKCCLEPNPVTNSATRICRDPMGVSSSSICTLPLAVGSCVAPSARFYYDAATGKCSRFTYSGCGGNANNFQSIASCQATCGSVGVKGTPSCPADASVGLNCLFNHTDACNSDADCLGRENGGQPSCCMTTCGYKICYQY